MATWAMVTCSTPLPATRSTIPCSEPGDLAWTSYLSMILCLKSSIALTNWEGMAYIYNHETTFKNTNYANYTNYTNLKGNNSC